MYSSTAIFRVPFSVETKATVEKKKFIMSQKGFNRSFSTWNWNESLKQFIIYNLKQDKRGNLIIL